MNKQPFILLGTTDTGEAITLSQENGLLNRFLWVQGTTGSGKSTWLSWLIISLLRMNIQVVLIDPHGDLARLCLSLLAASDFFSNPKSLERLQFIDFGRHDACPAFNVLKQEHLNNYQIAQNFLESIHRCYPSSSSGTTALLDNIIEYSAFVLCEHGLPITPYLQRFLLDGSYRNRLLASIADKQIVQFFQFTLSDKTSSTVIASTMRRLDLLTFSPTLRACLGTTGNILPFRSMWERGVSCLISLSGLSESEKKLLGCLLLVSVEQNFLSRLTLAPERRSKVALIVDEAPLFISQDETTFTTILEQCRKAGATCTTFANQTLSQLSKGMRGSLQNALSLQFRAGGSDSSELANMYYRKPVETDDTIIDWLSFTPRPSPGVFATCKNVSDARAVFENLKTAEAICMLPGRAVKIHAPTIPMKIDLKKLDAIEALYAQRILTSAKDIGKDASSPRLYLVKPQPTLQRRTLQPSTGNNKPFVLVSGNLEQDILTALTHITYASLQQLASLLSREKSLNYLRKKLTQMIDENKVAVISLPRNTGGKPLLLYCLPSHDKRSHIFLEHSLDCCAVLIAGVLLPTIEGLTLLDVKSERTLKTLLHTCPCIPDGLLTYQTKTGEHIHIAIEIDRSSENRDRIEQKLTSSSVWIEALGLDALTLAFIVTTGDSKRVAWLMEIANEANTDLADILLFAAVSGDTISPDLFTRAVFIILELFRLSEKADSHNE